MTDYAAGSRERSGLLYTVLLVVVCVYIFRLVQMQIVQHEEYETKSSGNSIKPVEITPLRGVFYDRSRQLIAENTPTYTVRIIPADYNRKLNPVLEKVLGFDSGYVANLLYKNRQFSKFVPIKLKRGVDLQVVGWISENQDNLSGVDYIIEMQRGYPDSIMVSHAFGYTKEISPVQLKKDDYYAPGDLIGYNGIERKYEKMLRGVKGYRMVVVDSKRREVSRFKQGLKDIPSTKGKDLVLGLDAEIQRIAEQELKGKSGAVVAIEPASGEILALASAPDYDLNEFSYSTSRSYLQELYSDPLKPQFNRATMATHPPGSTFKILCAIAALDLGVITPQTTLYCGGGFTFGRFFKCHGSHGSINVVHAIEHSCNTFFYQLIFKIGLDRLAAYAGKFGLGRRTGVDITEESPGLIPTEKYYEKIYGKNWPQGILVSLGIGQGEISVTPLQLAHYTALIANNGTSFVPHMVKGYLDENKKFFPLEFPAENTGIRREIFDIVKEGMFLVVQGSGTATNVRIPGIPVAGKTGTAQNPHGKDHSYFIGYAPADNPKIAVAVLVENSGFGATWAAPIAKKVIESYIRRHFRELIKAPDKIMASSATVKQQPENHAD